MSPTWDLALLVFFAASVVYGFLMGREKIIVSILGSYVGLVVANQWGEGVFEALIDQSAVNTEWLQGNLAVFITKVVLFTVVILIVALKGGLLAEATGLNGSFLASAMPLVFSLSSAVLIASSVLDFLPEETKNQIVSESVVAAPLVGYYSWWLILPIILLMFSRVTDRE